MMAKNKALSHLMVKMDDGSRVISSERKIYNSPRVNRGKAYSLFEPRVVQ